MQERMDTGQLEVVPWTDVYVRDHRFDQDAMLSAVEKLIGFLRSDKHGRFRLESQPSMERSFYVAQINP